MRLNLPQIRKLFQADFFSFCTAKRHRNPLFVSLSFLRAIFIRSNGDMSSRGSGAPYLQEIKSKEQKGTARIISQDTVQRLSTKKLLKHFYHKFMKNGVTCPKCKNLAALMPLHKLSSAIRDFLTENYVFDCFAYWCDICEEADVETPNYR